MQKHKGIKRVIRKVASARKEPFTPEQRAAYKEYKRLINSPPPPPAPPPKKLTVHDIHSWLEQRDAPESQELFEFSAAEEFDPDVETCTIFQAKEDFYEENTGYKKVQGLKRLIPVGKDPIRTILNPEGTPHGMDVFHPSMWYVLYGYRYWVTVEQNICHPILGPHVAMLNLQVVGQDGVGKPARHEWLGTAQFEFPFANPKELLIQLRRAIRTRDYFCSPDIEEYIIVFARDEGIAGLDSED